MEIHDCGYGLGNCFYGSGRAVTDMDMGSNIGGDCIMEKCKYCATCFDAWESAESIFREESDTPIGKLCFYGGLNSKREFEFMCNDNTIAIVKLKYCPMCGRKLDD